MPKIIIKEYDKTSAGIGAYANFSVVVPGYVKGRTYDTAKKAFMYGGKTIYYSASSDIASDKGESVFDDNGVYECSNKEDFENYIGKVAASEAVTHAAVAAVCKSTGEITETEFNTRKASGELYSIVGETTEKGYLKDGTNEYEAISASAVWSETATYSIIEKGKEGSDEEKGKQYGNQIAYELIKLGYTVLYKNLTVNTDLENEDYWKALKDKSTYDFRYICNGLLKGNAYANNAIIDLVHFVNTTPEVTGRGDCIALIDVDETAYNGKNQTSAITEIEAIVKAIPTASKYAAIFAPYVTYVMKDDSAYANNKTFPGFFHYLACAARAAENYNEWYAIAGYTRGISNFVIDSVGCKFGEVAINALEPRHATNNINKAVNLIVKIKNDYYLWGNRTAELLGNEGADDGDLRASHFLNIRQLCTTIKKQVYVTCKKHTFDPNSDTLWINFCNAIRPTLEKMKADQGITDYKFVKVPTTKKATLVAKIRIVPIEAVEDFDISLTLEDSISGVNADVSEE